MSVIEQASEVTACGCMAEYDPTTDRIRVVTHESACPSNPDYEPIRFAYYRVVPGVYRTTDRRFTIRKTRSGPRGGVRWTIEAPLYNDAAALGSDGERTHPTKDWAASVIFAAMGPNGPYYEQGGR